MAFVRKYGIDISYHQGTIDWAAVKAVGIDFVVIRAGFGNGDVDTQFVRNITGAAAAGINNIGIYWFSYAHDAATAEVEVAFMLNTIEPYRDKINLPVWFDWESASYSYVQRSQGISLTGAQIRDIATAWCNKVTAAGYTTGIYSNKNDGENWFKQDNGEYLWTALGVDMWYARYGANDETNLFIIPAIEPTALSEHSEMLYLQYSSVGIVRGISSNSVDLNVWYAEETPVPPPTPPDPDTPTPYFRTPANSIEYVEIRSVDRDLIGICDDFKSVLWHRMYYGCGDFEIYTPATEKNFALLRMGRYITRPNSVEVGIIEHVETTFTPQDGRMLIVSGRFAKSILDRRVIYKRFSQTSGGYTFMRVNVSTISGNVENAAWQLVNDNAVNCTSDTQRNIPFLKRGELCGTTKTILDSSGNAASKQVTYEPLMTYTDGLLAEYSLGARLELDEDTLNLLYTVFEGADRSMGNAAGNNPLIFSQDFDNLLSTKYSVDRLAYRNTAIIGGAGEGTERFISFENNSAAGIDRYEVFIDAKSSTQTLSEDGVDTTISNPTYYTMLQVEGKQQLAALKQVETFEGDVDVTNSGYEYGFGGDFDLGDIITMQDTALGIYANVRILESTEAQDENGYKINIEYGA